ncbi:MAG: glycosyltransferase, partial [Bacteroidota bacterium]|nr:glycosyltransferase [Bacteroidota bacterium]
QYDALIFPSIIEEMVGLVVMEAFAAGIPVIGSDVKGIAEQITDGETGLLFETGNVKALGEILKEVLDNPAKLKSLSGNIIMPKKFDEIAIYSLTVYKEALDKKTVDIR